MQKLTLDRDDGSNLTKYLKDIASYEIRIGEGSGYDVPGETAILNFRRLLAYNDLGRLIQFKVDGAAKMYYSYNSAGLRYPDMRKLYPLPSKMLNVAEYSSKNHWFYKMRPEE
ncbi:MULTISPECIES: hypothetical protein [unclassified Lysobacter]|uniref:hypothetical protein n=1 Tax=unclassified Lysobacter TaxID=2635362 RepID=UPI001BECEDFC|nr:MULTISPECIES: hypothetical protein [unclassified Lysobacter]MBT2745440.1 hypothetical protein [Lysobacter sp. ISL-42]MBT2776982.1 hypothetical protein [Lysobacter sp. ISL-54]MBT2781502.1 hypothetical protein [Lysobacter sp. ISL-52]